MFAWLFKLWPFNWPGSRAEDAETVPQPEHPLLLIPGICGTQLAVRRKGSNPAEDVASRVWVCIAHAVRFLQALTWTLLNIHARLVVNVLR